MFRINSRHVTYMLFAFVVVFGLLLSSGQRSRAHNSPGGCDMQNMGCLASCPIDPATGEIVEWCATQCQYDHVNCENSVFGSNLSPDNFLLPVSTGCSKYFTSYKRNCTLNGGMIPRHRPVYDACIASGFSVDECCDNIANDFANSISECTEF